MKRLAFVVMLGVFMALGTRHASATLCSVPNTFTNGTVADANAVNANFSAFQTCGNNIDHSNIGTAGIYASQLVPVTVAQAIFGGGVGYTFDPNVSNQVPLTIIGATSQSADLLDVFSVGQTTKYVWVDSSGVLHTNQAMALGGVPTWTGALPIVQGGTGATTLAGANIAVTNANNNFSASQSITGGLTATGMITAGGTCSLGTSGDLCAFRNTTQGALILGGSGSSITCDYNVTNASNLTCSKGIIATTLASAAGGSTNSFVPPVYTASGGAVASTMHGVVFSGTFPASTVSCGPYSNSYCVSITLSGAAVFSSVSSWSCGPVTINGYNSGFASSQFPGNPADGVASNDGTHFYVSDGVSNSASKTFVVHCWGT